LLLFLVPADANDIREEYEILLNELRQFNPELLDKQRVLAISKSDLLDDDLKSEIAKDLPELPYVFISSHNELGLMQLKDMLWIALNPLKP
jgi:GTP-binding protein